MLQLPVTSRLARIQQPAALWTTTDYLLANIIDLLAGANWQRAGGKGRKPTPVERPGGKTNRRRMGTSRPLHEARDLLDRWRNGQLHAVEGRRSHIHRERGVTHGR